MQLMSMSSNLKRSPSGNKYTVSVKYTASGKPGMYWTVMTNSFNTKVGGGYSTPGWTEYTKTNKTYTSGIEFNQDLLQCNNISVRLYDTPNFVDLVINMSDVLQPQTNIIENVPITIANNCSCQGSGSGSG